MYRKERKSLSMAMSYNNSASERNQPLSENPKEIKPDMKENRLIKELNYFQYEKEKRDKEEIISTEKLQEAIIWSEILGKPVSKRRKRR